MCQGMDARQNTAAAPESNGADTRPKRRRRLSDRQELFVITFILIFAAVAFMHLLIQFFNNDVMHLEVGDCCRTYSIWRTINLVNVFEWAALAAVVAAAAAYVII